MARKSSETDDAIVASVSQHGGVRAAAAALGVPYATFQRDYARAKTAKAASAPGPTIPVLPLDMAAFAQAIAAAFVAAQSGAAPAVTAPNTASHGVAEPSPELVRGVKARRQARATRDDAAEKPVAGGAIPAPESRRVGGSRFVLTSAQNNTYVHTGFLRALHVFCDVQGAELLISRFAYNTKGWGAQAQKAEKDGEDLWYAPEIGPHVCDESVEIAPGLVFCGELNVSPTATDPLSGLDSYTRSASAIVPHAKVAMKSMATMKHEPARFLYTTGTVTQRNYVAQKAGQKAEFHHVFGALYVEVDDEGFWFARQLVADDTGAFQDLDTVYTATGTRNSHVEAITWGDFHEEKADPAVFTGCFGPGGILETLRPRQQHVHDLADMRARNHHNARDPYFLATMHVGGMERVEDDMARCAVKLEAIERPWCRTVVVESNHDQALKRWLCEADGHRDAPNARYWHYWNFRIFEAIERREDLFVFEAAVRAKAKSALVNTTFLREDTSWVICESSGGIECGLHGHRGPNGSRGSPKSYRQLGRRCNTGHTHSAGIVDGVYTAGVSGSMDMQYNCGPSSWSQSHILTYPNGKRCVLTMRGAKWRA